MFLLKGTSVAAANDWYSSSTGLRAFHFRVSVVSGVSFCNLVEEFQVRGGGWGNYMRRVSVQETLEI